MKTKFFISFSLVLLSITLFAQDKVYLPYFETINMNSNYSYSISKLSKTYLEIENKYQVLLPDENDTLILTVLDDIQTKAKAKDCKYFIMGELNRLSSDVIVSVKLYETSTKKIIWSDLLKAKTPDDLDPIIYKIAKNIGTINKASQDGDIYAVTNHESEELKQINANYMYGVSVGGGMSFLSGLENNFPAGFAAMFSYDTRDLIMEIRGETYFSDFNMYNINLDVLYPFSKDKNTFYAGGGLGFGGTTVQYKSTRTEISYDYNNYNNNGTEYSYEYMASDSKGGLTLALEGGYILNRNSNVQIRLGGKFFAQMYKVKIKDNEVYPTGLMINLTILFAR